MSASTHSITVLARIDAHSPAAKPRLSSPSPISRTACAVCAQVHSLPDAQLLLAHQDAVLAHRGGVPEHRRHGLARHHDIEARLQIGGVPQVAHRQFFFFFQRRSPRTPLSLTPR